MNTLEQYVWSLRYFPIDNPYFDEPNETIESGYYVVGHLPDDAPEHPRTILRIDSAVGPDGADTRHETAVQIVEAFNKISTAVAP